MQNHIQIKYSYIRTTFFGLNLIAMPFKLPPHHVFQICVALYYGWKVAWIAAATQVHYSTIYRMRTSLDVWGTPYPPPIAQQGRPQALAPIHKQVHDNQRHGVVPTFL